MMVPTAIKSTIAIIKYCIASGETISANKEKCENYIEGSLAMCTSLAPIIGYDAAAKIAYEAFKSGKTIREIALEQNILEEKELEKVLDPNNMIHPK